MKLMTHCFWYFTLKLGAYLISFAFIIGGLSASILLSFRDFYGGIELPRILSTIITASVILHVILFLSSLVLLYGLCLGKPWTLVQFILVSFITIISEIVTIVFLVQERDTLPSECTKTIAAKAFIIFALLFSAAEIYSLYVEWHEDPNNKTDGVSVV